MTAPDGRIWTVERVDIEPREKKPRRYPHEIDEDDVWWLALFSPRVDLLLGCGFFVILVVIGVALPLTCALALTGAAYATERYRRHLRRRGRAPWTIRASTAPTEYEHGIAYAWAVMGDAESGRAVDACADAIDAGTSPDRLAPGPPVTP